MKLTGNIHLLRLDFEIQLSPDKKLSRFVNSIIVFGDKITLIDTGVKGSEKAIFSYIEQNNGKISDISTVILSHSHPDHIGSAAKIKEMTNCEILAHESEAAWIENIELQNKERPVPGFFGLVDKSVKIDRFLLNGQVLKASDNITLEIIHAPGHSKGSLNVLFKEANILFTADSIPLKNDIPNYDNFMDLMGTLKSIKNKSRSSTVLTSWTPPLTDRTEIVKILSEGEAYGQSIGKAVKESYTGNETEPLTFCKSTLQKLGLPAIWAMPLVDKAFRSHLR